MSHKKGIMQRAYMVFRAIFTSIYIKVFYALGFYTDLQFIFEFMSDQMSTVNEILLKIHALE